jgi:hypothetical protein
MEKSTETLVKMIELNNSINQVNKENEMTKNNETPATDKAMQYESVLANVLSNTDHWFDCNLRALLGAEIALIKKGKKKQIDRKMLADWITNHL